MALIEKLKAIGDAIRSKTGGSELLSLDDMVDEIEGISGGGGDITITPLNYQYIGNGLGLLNNDVYINIADNITIDISYLFTQMQELYNNIIVNFSNTSYDKIGIILSNLFSAFKINNCNNIIFSNFENLPIVPKTSSSMNNLFYNGTKLKYLTLNIVNFINKILDNYDNLFQSDPFLNFQYCFYNNDNLRGTVADALRSKILSENIQSRVSGITLNNSRYCCYFQPYFHNCQIEPFYNYRKISSGTLFLLWNNSTLSNCGLRHFVFKPFNTDSSYYYYPNVMLDLTDRIGYCISRNQQTENGINSLERYNNEKDDENAWFWSEAFSGYNHDSAVETINSLPDMTLNKNTTNTFTYTIKLKGSEGSSTDEGAINTLTAEEIAVATAKGWTVTLV